MATSVIQDTKKYDWTGWFTSANTERPEDSPLTINTFPTNIHPVFQVDTETLKSGGQTRLTASLSKHFQILPELRNQYDLLARLISRAALRNDDETSNNVINNIAEYRRQSASGNLNDANLSLFNRLDNQSLADLLMAYSLLAKISIVASDASHSNRKILNNGFLDDIIPKNLSPQEKKKLLEELLSMSLKLIITAHPTSAMDPSFFDNIQQAAEILADTNKQKILSKYLQENPEGPLPTELRGLEECIQELVRGEAHSSRPIQPIDESKRYTQYMKHLWNILPKTINDLEYNLRYKFKIGDDLKLPPNFFQLHNWTARDIDGNPTVSLEQHLRAVAQERLFTLQQYATRVEAITDTAAMAKITLTDEEFNKLYNMAKRNLDYDDNQNLPYQVVVKHQILKPLEQEISRLKAGLAESIAKHNSKHYEELLSKSNYDLEKNLRKPLEAIIRNKQSNQIDQASNDNYTKEYAELLIATNIFGLNGSIGNFRQLSNVNKSLAQKLNLETEDLKKTTEELLATKKKRKPNPENLSPAEKQSHDILSHVHCGGVSRFIISMNHNLQDLLNALNLAKAYGHWNPTTLKSDLEIVPLTEELDKFQNSYQLTIDALSNEAWLKYLIGRQGVFTKMRGPSDGTKQQGFLAAQWEIFRSKEMDSLVARVFNAYLDQVYGKDRSALKELEDSISKTKSKESQVMRDAAKCFKSIITLDNTMLRDAYNNGFRVTIANFDGLGEPTERGGGTEFDKTLSATLPDFADINYERTVQGGGAASFGIESSAQNKIQDLFRAAMKVATRKAKSSSIKVFDTDLANLLDSTTKEMRRKLRADIFGMELDRDENDKDILQSQENLEQYFSHVLLSPLAMMGLLNIASRPITRTANQLSIFAERFKTSDGKQLNPVDLAKKIVSENNGRDALDFLDNVRAIPYVAMFSLLGANHVSFYGLGSLNNAAIKKFSKYYKEGEGSQEGRLVKHLIDNIELALTKIDFDVYSLAHSKIQKVYDPNYNPDQDPLIQKLKTEYQAAIQVIAKIKNYNTQLVSTRGAQAKFTVDDLLQDKPEFQALMHFRRHDAAALRLGLAEAIANLYRKCHQNNINPFTIQADNKALEQEIKTLQTAFVAASNAWGTGCLDA